MFHDTISPYSGKYRPLSDADVSRMIEYLVKNISTKLTKIRLGNVFGWEPLVSDYHIVALVERCKKITELDLQFANITNVSLNSIMKNLQDLVKLNIEGTNIRIEEEMKKLSMTKLQILNCWHDNEILKTWLPNIVINQEFKIAHFDNVNYNLEINVSQ